MIVNSVIFPIERIDAICRHYGAAKLSLFGSILRDDFHAGSDVDILVEFRVEAKPTLFSLAAMQADLTDLLARKVDLRMAGELSRQFREEVVAGSRILHAA